MCPGCSPSAPPRRSRSFPLPDWPWRRLVLSSTLVLLAVAVFSEWTNTALGRWSYSTAMPALTLGPGSVGLSPLVQWLVVQPLSVYFARQTFGMA